MQKRVPPALRVHDVRLYKGYRVGMAGEAFQLMVYSVSLQ